MEDSILISTKGMLGLAADFAAFDLEILTHINSAFSTLKQLGVTAAPIEDDTGLWSELALPDEQLSIVKTLVFMKVRQIFDPPATSYAATSLAELIKEQEVRLTIFVDTPEEVEA